LGDWTPGESALASVPLLAGLDHDALAGIAAASRRVEVDAGTRLFGEGEPADALYVVLSGRLRAVTGAGEDERVLREMSAGSAVGELALLTGGTRSASIVAVRDSVLLAVDRRWFEALLAERPGAALGVARELARQLQASGGVATPSARPCLFAFGALDNDVRLARLVQGLADRLAAWGPVAVLDGTEGHPDDAAGRVDRAERASAHLLLVEGSSPAWDALCRRQADRRVMVATAAAAPPARPDTDDLVLLGPMDGGRLTALLDAVASPRYHRLATTEPEDPGLERLARRLVGRSLGVVFSGGGARGYAHIGVMRALEEAGIVVDRYGGCSMGGFMAAMGAATWRSDDIRARCEEELVRRSPFNDYTLPRVALIRSRKARSMLLRLFGEMLIEELPKPLFTVTADLLSSSSVIHRRGTVFEAVGSSMSIPGLAPPVRLGGRLLVDGAVLNNLPVDVMAESAEGPILAVDVAGRPEASTADPGGRLPSILETLSRATVLSSAERSTRNRALATVVIDPAVQDVALRGFHALDRAVEAGYAAASAALEGGAADTLRAAVRAPVA
jgi:predicted acylesterase/phospholipase RssA/CRP-like cAMP-binding protein